MLTVMDLFCGTGGISYGLSKASSSLAVAAGLDLDEAACATAKSNHPQALIRSLPVEEVDPREFAAAAGTKRIDVIVGGPPCQGFSSLRPSRGTTLSDPRNHLYAEFQRFVGELRPKVFLLENVVGLVNATKGELLSDLIQGFEDLGYVVDWRVINAANFGVPQKRERFLLLGARSDCVPEGGIVFPTPTHMFSGRTIGIRDKERRISNEVAGKPALTAWDALSDLPSIDSGSSSDRYSSRPRNQFQRSMRSGRTPLSLHVAANHNEKMLRVIRHAGSSKSELPEGMVTSGYSSCYSRISPDEPAPTITVKFTSPSSSKCIHPFDDRAITPREAARLQTFPDGFLFEGSKTEIASQIGNAVPPLLAAVFAPLIEEIAGARDDG
jgi:DNA (cytosine-5)-methyltransferase 1